MNKKTLPVLQQILTNIPLISNRDLTLTDILPFVYGEIGWFFHNDGTRSIALRSKQEALPIELLDAKHIVLQKGNGGVFLLSEKMQPISGLQSHFRITELAPTLFKTKLGTYHEKSAKKSSRITYRSQRISFGLPMEVGKDVMDIKYVPDNTFLFLSTPVLSNTKAIHNTVAIFSNITAPLIPEPMVDFFENIVKNNGHFLLTNKDNPSFLFASKAQISNNTRISILQTSLALKNPSKRTFSFPDGTVAKELMADPSLIPVEVRTIEGMEFYRATTEDTAFFASKDGDMIVSNDERSLRAWISQTQEEKKLMPCDTNMGFAFVNDLFDAKFESEPYYQSNALIDLLSRFEIIGLKSTRYRTNVHMCF